MGESERIREVYSTGIFLNIATVRDSFLTKKKNSAARETQDNLPVQRRAPIEPNKLSQLLDTQLNLLAVILKLNG